MHEINVKFIEEMDKQSSGAIKKAMDCELNKLTELHGKKYNGLVFQHQKHTTGDRLRI